MLGIYDIHRRYEQQLTREFIDIDAKDVAPYYLSRLESVAILAKWENRPKALFNYISKLRSSRGETKMAFAASELESVEAAFYCLIGKCQDITNKCQDIVSMTLSFSISPVNGMH